MKFSTEATVRLTIGPSHLVLKASKVVPRRVVFRFDNRFFFLLKSNRFNRNLSFISVNRPLNRWKCRFVGIVTTEYYPFAAGHFREFRYCIYRLVSVLLVRTNSRNASFIFRNLLLKSILKVRTQFPKINDVRSSFILSARTKYLHFRTQFVYCDIQYET